MGYKYKSEGKKKQSGYVPFTGFNCFMCNEVYNFSKCGVITLKLLGRPSRCFRKSFHDFYIFPNIKTLYNKIKRDMHTGHRFLDS